MTRLKVGVVGVGQGRSHLRAFQVHPDAEVVAVCDRDQPRATAVADEHGIERTYDSLDQLLEQRDIDVVVIATPDHLHGPMAIQALKAGKHVLSEIPMATDPAEMKEIVALSERTGLKYHMGNQVRFAPCLLSIKAMIDQGRFGDIFYGEGEYFHEMHYAQHNPDGTRRWRADLENPQTTMLGGGPHALDCLRWLMNVENFIEVQAYGSRMAMTDRPIDDFTVAIFKADTGAIAKIGVAYGLARPYCLYYSVYGTRATFERTRIQEPGAARTVNYVYFRDVPFAAQMIPMDVYNWSDPALARSGSGHGTMELAQAQAFIKAIREDSQPPIDAREAARSCLALWCALEAARTGKPVRIEAIA